MQPVAMFKLAQNMQKYYKQRHFTAKIMVSQDFQKISAKVTYKLFSKVNNYGMQ